MQHTQHVLIPRDVPNVERLNSITACVSDFITAAHVMTFTLNEECHPPNAPGFDVKVIRDGCMWAHGCCCTTTVIALY
ncbi:hypothetical protein BaRGS_00009009 [Batillaria attramentaria]|uniref:Uncharacterized protein n=1 Tax=Batillaria attramentaria TaxID=370345 RepID=A0ABD0LKP0_9CAEN